MFVKVSAWLGIDNHEGCQDEEGVKREVYMAMEQERKGEEICLRYED